jgi:hypothetical protein
MKKKLAVIALLCCVSGTALAQDKECSLGSLRGDYVFSASGHSLIAGVWSAEGDRRIHPLQRRRHADGDRGNGANAGNSGNVTQSPPGGTGTYVLDANCKGSCSSPRGRASTSSQRPAARGSG